MLFFMQIVMLAGVFAWAAASQELRSYSFGQHIGAALVVAMVTGWLLPFALPTGMLGATHWLAHDLLCGVAAWLASWPLARIIYGADSRQAVVIATYAAGGILLVNLFMRWAVS